MHRGPTGCHSEVGKCRCTIRHEAAPRDYPPSAALAMPASENSGATLEPFVGAHYRLGAYQAVG
jgi:hypothetical protein